MLRKRIEERLSKGIAADLPASEIALQLCVLLENELDLGGNGWWDLAARGR